LTEIDEQVYVRIPMCTFFVYLCIWLLHLNVCPRQNIDADIGRVIAKVSSQANPTTSAKGPEHKKDKKKDKQSAQDVATKHKDDINQGPSVEILAIDPSKDKKKKKKSKKIHSSTTSTTPEISTHQEQIGSAHVISDTEPQGTNKGTTQNVLQNKTLDHNNESSNSCLQPPPVMVCLLSFPYLKYIVKQLSSSFNILVSFLSLSDTCLNHT
jgi:hypothetical protein